MRNDTEIITPFPSGPMAAQIVRSFPGRKSVHQEPAATPPKPTEEETPYRSLYYINERSSSDGNAYAKGEPIPEIEAIRQGIPDGETAMDVMDVAYDAIYKWKKPVENPQTEKNGWSLPQNTCLKCEGSGKRSKKVAANHKVACKCVACKPCAACEGTGVLPDAVEVTSES